MVLGSNRHSSRGSASTLLIEANVASLARVRAPFGSSRNSLAGMCNPKTVSVCAPEAARSASRIEESDKEWQ